MKFKKLHPFHLTPREAIRVQSRLRKRIQIKPIKPFPPRLIAGADIAVDTKNDVGFAAVIVYTFPELKEVERSWVKKKLDFPYIPGLLAFREAPILLEAFSKLKSDPDVLLFDGQGIAHPRRLGIASHMGLLLGKSAIGCGKSRLCGIYSPPPPDPGAWTYLREGKEILGAVLRTQKGCKPIFISIGHRITLKQTLEIALRCCGSYRIPKPTREADICAKEAKSY